MGEIFFKDYEMHVTQADCDNDVLREVELKITTHERDSGVPYYCQPDTEVEIVSIDPPCEITDKIQDDMESFIEGEIQ